MIDFDPTRQPSIAAAVRSLELRATALARGRRIPPPTAKGETGSGTYTPGSSWGSASLSCAFYVPPSGRVLLAIRSLATTSASPTDASLLELGYVMSGANTGGQDDYFLSTYITRLSGGPAPLWPFNRTTLVEGLNPGLTAFTLRHKRTGGSFYLDGPSTGITVVGL